MNRLHRPRRRRLPSRLAALAALAATPALLTGCSGWGHIQLRQDDRLEITAPRNLSTVTLPFEVRWTAPQIEAGASSESISYAVLLDRYPMPPGKDLHHIVNSVRTCRGSDACLQPDYLAERFGVYVTSASSVTVERFPTVELGQVAPDSRYATIVLIDSEGRRIGESVWYVSFKVQS